jgi:hypothetical protein
MDSGAAAEIAEDIAASFTGLAVVLRGGEGSSCSRDGDPLRRRAQAALTALAGVAGSEPKVAALKVLAAADYAESAGALMGPATSPGDHRGQEMAVVAEVACVLTVSERAAGALVSEAHELTTALPLTLSALQDGSISWQHARYMVDETANLDPAGAAALEAHFLDPDAPNPARGCPAGEMVPSRFRHKARTWRERHHPVSIEKRYARSAADRRLECSPDRDGMAWLSAYLPADTAYGIWNRTTAAARALQGPDETRALSQIRADIAATLLLTKNIAGGTNGTNGTTEMAGAAGTTRTAGMAGMVGTAVAGRSAAGPEAGPDAGMTGKTEMAGAAGMGGDRGPGVPSTRAQVLVTVPVLSLLGLTEEPAMLDGYGPIPPSMARQLIAEGAESFHRVLIDPRDGAPLEIGRTSYRVTKAQRQWLRMRDGKCPFPGCSNQSLDNEADHVLAWAHGGTTGISNLGQPCPRHHRLKHTSGWTPTAATKNEPPGWMSPSGRHYASEQPDWEPPIWPELGPEPILQADAGVPEGLPPDYPPLDYPVPDDELQDDNYRRTDFWSFTLQAPVVPAISFADDQVSDDQLRRR